MSSHRKTRRHLFLPELIEENPGPWEVHQVEIREAAVDLVGRRAFVPEALTRAQRLARLHELGHVKYTPRDWTKLITGALAHAAARNEKVDPTTVLRIAKMLEENRVDWLLWDRHGLDLRPARESLDWSVMPPPPDALSALSWVLQLAWTVWGSEGITGIPNMPDSRIIDEATKHYYNDCWVRLFQVDGLAQALVRGCKEMYRNPTHDTRDKVAAELAAFFPPKDQEEQPPPAKKEEQEAQQEARREIEEIEEIELSREREEQGGVGSDTINMGHYEIHDHTLGIRRPSVRIARRETPYPTGTKLTFPHRYLLDKAVFARRTLTEGGIMIDGSGSMNWTAEDMAVLLEKMPAVTIGFYGGIRSNTGNPDVFGRICILAKKGRFSRYDSPENAFNMNNDIDLEALQLLATWPKPRFWLSDGYVCGGKHWGPHPDEDLNSTYYMQSKGRLVHLVDQFMKAHEILRVRTKEDMHRLVRKQRVTLYRTSVNHQSRLEAGYPDNMHPPELPESPVSFQL